MGLLKNISSMIRSNLNELLNRAEDPEKMLSSLILDMKESYLNAKNEVKNAIVELKRIENEAEENAASAAQWEEKALLALDAGRDDLAKESLRRKRNFEKLAQALEQEAKTQHRVVEDLREQLTALKAKLDEAKAKKSVISTARRIRKGHGDSAHGAQDVQARLSVDLSPFELYDRMEEKIRALENEVAALREVEPEESFDDVDRELEKLASSDIEEELKDLRRKASGGGRSAPESPRGSSKDSDKSTDDSSVPQKDGKGGKAKKSPAKTSARPSSKASPKASSKVSEKGGSKSPTRGGGSGKSSAGAKKKTSKQD